MPKTKFIIELDKQFEFMTKACNRSNMPFNKTTLQTYLLDDITNLIEYAWEIDNLRLLASAINFRFDIMYFAVSTDWDTFFFASKYMEAKREFLEPKRYAKQKKEL